MKNLNTYVTEKLHLNKDIKIFDSDFVKNQFKEYNIDLDSIAGKLFFSWCEKNYISKFKIYSHFDFISSGNNSKRPLSNWNDVSKIADTLYDDVHKHNKGKWYEIGSFICYETDDAIGLGNIENNKFRNVLILKKDD